VDSREQRDWLEQMAHDVAKLLKDNGAVKPSNGDGGVFQPMPAMDICVALDIDRLMLAPIKLVMAEIGYNISFNHHGQYLGCPGESIIYPAYCTKLCRAMAKGTNDYMMALARTNKLDEAKRMAQIELGCKLHEIPAWLKSMGVPMPKQLEAAWLALPSGDTDDHDPAPAEARG